MPLPSSLVPVLILCALLFVSAANDDGSAAGATHPTSSFQFTQVHMGLPVRIVLYAADEAAARDAAAASFARIAALDAVMSDYRPDSELSLLNARAGEWVTTSPPLFDVLQRACTIARLTGGAFDPAVGPAVTLWREARRTRRLPSPEALAAARARIGWSRIEVDPSSRAIRLAPGTQLDLGAIAKGYILQEALRTLAARGIASAMLEAGGDIVVGAAPPSRDGWQIDVEMDGDIARRARRLAHAALATSGPTMQFVEIDGVRYSHVVDPRIGIGLTHGYLAYVIAADGATADALATAATVLGPDGLLDVRRRFPSAHVEIFKP